MGSEGFGVAQYAEWEVSLEELCVQKGGIPEQRGVLVGNVPVEQCGAGNSPWYSSVWGRMYVGCGGVWCGKRRTYVQWKSGEGSVLGECSREGSLV